VLRPGGRAVVSSWVPADRAPVIGDVEHVLQVPSVLDYWRTLERCTPPLLAIQEAVPVSRWAELSGAIARRLEARFGPGPLGVPLRAFLGAGTRSPG